jgi:hypothetical protein
MKAQRKITIHRVSAKERELEQLLRRAARYAKAGAEGNARLKRRKRSKAA